MLGEDAAAVTEVAATSGDDAVTEASIENDRTGVAGVALPGW